MRGNRSAAVTAIGGGVEDGAEEEGWGKVKVLMPKLETCVRQMLDYAWEMVHGLHYLPSSQ